MTQQTVANAKKDPPALRIVRMADVEAEAVQWLWYPYIPYGKLTILEGDPSVGKSYITCALASAVSRGRGLPEIETFDAGNTLMLSAEDGLADTLRPRLDAFKADVSRVFALAEALTLDEKGLLQLRAEIIRYEPALVIIDPFFAFTGSKMDIHRANECRAVTASLSAIAEEYGCAVVVVRHLGKSHGGGHAINAGIGSIDLIAAARSVLLAGVDPDDKSCRAIVQIKNNLSERGATIGYSFEDGSFRWIGISDLTAERILSFSSDETAHGALQEAIEFLSDILASGALEMKEIMAQARKAGISEQTLRRAKKRLSVSVRKEGMPRSAGQRWLWALPDTVEGQARAEDGQKQKDEHLRASSLEKQLNSQHLDEDAQHYDFEHLHAQEWLSSDEHVLELDNEEMTERAAIIEYEANIPRAEAERLAREQYAAIHEHYS
jgi:hypothetical protein